VKLVAVADTHGEHCRLTIPDGDVFLHAGDLTERGTLEQLADAARATDSTWKIEVLHPETAQALRAELAQSNDPSRRYVINFDRFPLFGMGGGHHSPIGGVLDPEGLIFVLDVNEKFGPWLVTPERLFEAMDTVDSSSGQKRGLLRFTR
jgi:hypothetical protein